MGALHRKNIVAAAWRAKTEFAIGLSAIGVTEPVSVMAENLGTRPFRKKKRHGADTVSWCSR